MSSSSAKGPSAATIHPRQRLGRALLLLAGIVCLITGIWGGLLRLSLPIPLPVDHANWISFHGPLMVSGFLGTLISLERAVGLRAIWTYLVPALAGTGSLAIAAGALGEGPRWLITAGSGLFVLVSLRILSIQPVLSNVVMGLGAAAWLGGNVLWASGREIPQVVLWWLSFLFLTILGERIELTRFQKPHRWSRPWLVTALGVLGAGLAAGAVNARAGGLLVGVATLGLAVWLLRFDLAWRTIRQPGLPRFMAVCLLSGYVWLIVTALVVGATWPQSSGVHYDAALHAFFVGFVFSMIFGHAPVIFPVVLGLPIRFYPTAYVPLIVLHASVLLRVIADGMESVPGRGWGSAGNATAVALFLLNNVGSVMYGRLRSRRKALT